MRWDRAKGVPSPGRSSQGMPVLTKACLKGNFVNKMDRCTSKGLKKANQTFSILVLSLQRRGEMCFTLLLSIICPKQKRNSCFPLLGDIFTNPKHWCFSACLFLVFFAIRSCSQISWQFELVCHVARSCLLVRVLICFPSFRFPKMKFDDVIFGADVEEIHSSSSNPLCKLPGFSYFAHAFDIIKEKSDS